MQPMKSKPQRSNPRRAVRLWLLPILLIWLATRAAALRCRTDDGPSEAELKRITRACMRKIGEQTRGGSTGSSASSYSNNNNNRNNNHFYGPLHQFNYGANRYDDDDDDPNDDYNNNNFNHNTNTNSNSNKKNYNYSNDNGNYDRDRANVNNHNILQQRNRARQQNARGGTNSATTATTNNERRYDYSNNNGMANGNGNGNNGGGNTGGAANGASRNSGNNNNGYNGSNNNVSNQRDNNNNRKIDNGKNNNETFDMACIVHCFFDEMNMLNSDDYPDRYKVQYGLTRELRDRELRNFYTDTIQDCFHYLESQRRRDKCHYSRELINCMGVYAKANCDDWQEYNMIFN